MSALSIGTSPGFGGGPTATSRFDPAYAAGAVAAAFNNQPWTPTSFFSGPRVNAPDLIVFGTGKTYDFFA